MDFASCSSEIREHLTIDKEIEKKKETHLLRMFNEEQRDCFNVINQSVIDGEGRCFFLDGAGGCGKTTVAKILIHVARTRGQIVMACTHRCYTST